MNTSAFIRQTLDVQGNLNNRICIISEKVINDHLSGDNFCEASECWRFLKSPKYWGLLTKALMGKEGIPDSVKLTACRTSLSMGRLIGESQEPAPWIVSSLLWLDTNSSITEDDVIGARRSLIRSVRYSSNFIETSDDITGFISSILGCRSITYEQKINTIMITLLSKEVIGTQGVSVFNGVMRTIGHESIKRSICSAIVDSSIPFDSPSLEHPFKTSSNEKDLLSIRFIPEDIRRVSVVWLTKLVDDPLSVLRETLKCSVAKSFGGSAVISGSIDVIEDLWDVLGEDTCEELLSKSITIPDTGIRRRAYSLGGRMIGVRFLSKSLSDKAKSIRVWGEQAIGIEYDGDLN